MEVEVVFPEVCGAFYKAFVRDLNLSAGTVLLGFEKHWKQDTTVELDHVRLPPTTAAPATHFPPGTRVEALLPHLENEPSGWWTGSVLKSKGELHVVEFQSGGEKYQDIVEHDKLRMPNNNPPLSKVQFFKREIPVPDDIQEFCKRPKVHQNFCSKLHAVCVSYDDSQQNLVVIGDSEQCLEKAIVLSDIHFVDLATHMSLLSRNEMMTQQHQRHQDFGVYEIRFLVPGSLVGLAIGKDGGNVNEVRRMDGIINVEFDDNTSMFRVRAKNKDVLTKARDKLEYVHDTILIPRNLAGKVIGKKGSIIQSILEKSRVNNVKVVGDDQAKERNIDISTQVPFDIIGRRNAVDNARLMLEYHLDHLKDVESIIQSRREMDSQLQANNSYEETPTYFPRPGDGGIPYRGGRGYRRGGRSGGGYRGNGGRQRNSSRHSEGGVRGSSEQQLQQTESSERAQPAELSAQQQQPDRQEDTYVSDEEESESGHSVEEDGEESIDDRKSPPEDDEQGPDRRRQRGGYRGNRRGWRGGRGGGRGGRGGGRGGGGRHFGAPRPQQQQQHQGEEAASRSNGSTATADSQGDSQSQRPQRTTGRPGSSIKGVPATAATSHSPDWSDQPRTQ